MDCLFENYEKFIVEHQSDVNTPQGAMKMISDSGMFRSYVESLVEGLEPAQASVVKAVANRQREAILTEASNVPASSFGYGWCVLSFPILVDIYAEPIVAELCNVFPTQSPMVSIPRIKIKATTTSYDGTTKTTSVIPTAKAQIGAAAVQHALSPNTVENIFTHTTYSADEMKINRRYTAVVKVTVTETHGGDPGSPWTHDVLVNFRPDARNQILGTFTFNDHGAAPKVVTGTVNGNINYDTGDIMFSVLFAGGDAAHTFACANATWSFKFVPFATMKGRTTVKIETEMTDVTIDPNED